MTVVLELLTAQLEYLNFFDGFVQFAVVEAYFITSKYQHNSWFLHVPIMLEIMLN